MKKLLFTLAACMVVGTIHADLMRKYLNVAIEATGSGIVYMTSDEMYWENNDEHPAPEYTSKAGTYSELHYMFSGTSEVSGADLNCQLYFIAKANPGYGLFGFTETKKEDTAYEEKDFVLDVDGKRAKSGSLIDVNDPNTPWVTSGGDPEDPMSYSETPNKYYYAVFTEVPDFAVKDGDDMGAIPESPTNTYTVKYSRHFNKGLNAVFLPFAFDAKQYKSQVEGGEVYTISSYKKENNEAYAITARCSGLVPAGRPLLIYSPKEYDFEYVGADQAVTKDETPNLFVHFANAKQNVVGAFTNKTVGGKCYNLTYDGKDFAFAETENNISAFRFAIVFDDEAAAPVSKRITLNFTDDYTNGINTIEAAPRIANDGIYTLDGRRLNAEPTHGIFIKNGKKFVR